MEEASDQHAAICTLLVDIYRKWTHMGQPTDDGDKPDETLGALRAADPVPVPVHAYALVELQFNMIWRATR